MPDYDKEGLVSAWTFDGNGGARRIGWQEIGQGVPSGERFQWINLQQMEHRHGRNTWLDDHSGIDPSILESLVAAETRPRCALFDNGAFLNLRGINLMPYSLPDEMHSIRFWVEPHRIVSVRRKACRRWATSRTRSSAGGHRAPRASSSPTCPCASSTGWIR